MVQIRPAKEQWFKLKLWENICRNHTSENEKVCQKPTTHVRKDHCRNVFVEGQSFQKIRPPATHIPQVVEKGVAELRKRVLQK